MRKLLALGAFFSIGVLSGSPFTGVVNETSQNSFAFLSKSANFTVGPTFQVSLDHLTNLSAGRTHSANECRTGPRRRCRREDPLHSPQLWIALHPPGFRRLSSRLKAEPGRSPPRPPLL